MHSAHSGPAKVPNAATTTAQIAAIQAKLAELEGHPAPDELTAAVCAASPSRWSLAWIPLRSLHTRALVMLRGSSIDAEPGEIMAYLEQAGAEPPAHQHTGLFDRKPMPPLLDAAVIDTSGQPAPVLSSRLCGVDLRAAVRALRSGYQAEYPGRRMFGLVFPALLLVREVLAGAYRIAASSSPATAVTAAAGGVVTIAAAAAVGITPAPPTQPHVEQLHRKVGLAPAEKGIVLGSPARSRPTTAPAHTVSPPAAVTVSPTPAASSPTPAPVSPAPSPEPTATEPAEDPPPAFGPPRTTPTPEPTPTQDLAINVAPPDPSAAPPE